MATAVDKNDLSIILGAHNLSKSSEFGREVRGVNEIIIHEGWNPKEFRFTHDIALLTMNSSVEFSNVIQPICILNENEHSILKNKSAQVAAWGSIDDTDTMSNVPMIADLKIISFEKCSVIDSRISWIHWEESFCAYSTTTGICSGDSGSGLYVNLNHRYYLKGLVSSAVQKDCSNVNITIFTDVMKYYDFIKVSNFAILLVSLVTY
jgi:secreted trypsin-like serine protease